MKPVYVDRVGRFSLDVDEESGRTFVAISVRNRRVEYDEWYEVDRAMDGRQARKKTGN